MKLRGGDCGSVSVSLDRNPAGSWCEVSLGFEGREDCDFDSTFKSKVIYGKKAVQACDFAYKEFKKHVEFLIE